MRKLFALAALTVTLAACEHYRLTPPGVQREINVFPTFAQLLVANPAGSYSPSTPTVVETSRGLNPSFDTAKSDRTIPEDHRALFARNHGRAAAAKDAKCRYCHEGLSESSRDSCFDCHAVMRPGTHTTRFATTGHGRLSATNPSRCATCHEVDYCTGCHLIAPDTHFPISSFINNHARLARANARSCMTCHSFEATCAECHNATLNTPGSTNAGAVRRALRGRGF